MTDREIALAALDQLSYIRCDNYSDWIQVGMILQKVGCTVQEWDNWSRQSNKYKVGMCEKKWNSFSAERGFGTVTVGTLLQMVKDDGGHVELGKGSSSSKGPGYALEWDSVIGLKKDDAPIDPRWTEDAEIPAPRKDWGKDLSRYLRVLFKPDEKVSYNIKAWQPENCDKWLPRDVGVYTRTAGELIEATDKVNSADAVYYDQVTPAGGWIRFNPMDGRGVKDENVTDYRHALVESDNLPLEKQIAIYRQLELPIAAMVHSGGKSIHAIVKIGAGSDFEEYRNRVNFLFEVLKKSGFDVDRANRNPSRLSRLPGIFRGDNPQYLIAVNTGKASWEEWKTYIDEMNDNLPDIEDLSALAANPPPLAQEIIEGILRTGHKLLLAGPSKAGKSFTLMHLCLALGNGETWLEMQCSKGKVLYVNLEIDRASCVKRFIDIAAILKVKIQNVDVFNLRGKALPLNELAPRLVRRMRNRGYIAVVIDPLYKIITGDENNAADMTYFCNQLDYVATETKTAVIFASHFSKGEQGRKKAIDRTSGSGVFGRDPDAVLTMSELDVEGGNAYRIEMTLREFAPPEPINTRFRYPLHVVEHDLEDAKVVGDEARKGGANGRPKRISNDDIEEAIQLKMGFSGSKFCKIQDIVDYFNGKLKYSSIKYRVGKMTKYAINDGEIVEL